MACARPALSFQMLCASPSQARALCAGLAVFRGPVFWLQRRIIFPPIDTGARADRAALPVLPSTGEACLDRAYA